MGCAAPGGEGSVQPESGTPGLAVDPADKGRRMCAGKAFFPMCKVAPVAARRIQTK